MRNVQTWGALGRPFATGLVLSVALLLLPLAAIGEGKTAEEAPLLPASPTPVAEPTPQPGAWDGSQTLRVLQRDGTVTEMTMGDYLWCVVAAEMPASFEAEALRAQAVCARTYSLWKLGARSHEEDGADICADSACCQAYITPEDAAQRWAQDAQAFTVKVAGAVADTDGQVLTYGGAPIQAVFFSSAAGRMV